MFWGSIFEEEHGSAPVVFFLPSFTNLEFIRVQTTSTHFAREAILFCCLRSVLLLSRWRVHSCLGRVSEGKEASPRSICKHEQQPSREERNMRARFCLRACLFVRWFRFVSLRFASFRFVSFRLVRFGLFGLGWVWFGLVGYGVLREMATATTGALIDDCRSNPGDIVPCFVHHRWYCDVPGAPTANDLSIQ